MPDRRQRFRGALLGLAVGDALGTTVEFRRPGTFEPVTDMVGGGPFDLAAGAWTDDTSMALCLAESLVKRAGFDPVDQLQRYVRWYREGHWSSTGRCFDVGNATRAALERFERTREPYPGDAAPEAAGNGVLMRLAPVALVYAGDPLRAMRFAGLSARTTHGAPEAVDACRYFAALLVGALRGASTEELRAPARLHPKVAAVADGSFRDRRPPEIRGGGYVVDALEAALWALHSTRSFEEGVLAAVNLGDDADTTAAIFGQLAGAIYGVDGIPERWRRMVLMGDRIVEVADALLRLAEHTTAEEGPVPGSRWVQPQRLIAGPAPTGAAELGALADAGVTTLVDLSDDAHGLPRPDGVTQLHLPIREDGVRNDWRVIIALQALHFAMGDGERVYLHDDRGKGRVGMVLACLLIGNGAPATEVLHLISALGSRGLQVDDVARRLRAGGPVVVDGPQPGQRVQALAERDERLVRVEVHDGAAPAPPEFKREDGMWAWTSAGGDDAVATAVRLIGDVRAGWQLPSW